MEYEINSIKHLFYEINSDEVKCGGNSDLDHNAIVGDTCPTNILIPNNITIEGKTYKVTVLGKKAFMKCFNVQSISIPEGIKIIEQHCFDYTDVKTELKLPESLTRLESWALSSNSFPKLTIGSCLNILFPASFGGIHQIKEFALSSNDNPYFSVDDQKALYNKDKTILYALPELESFTIPATVKQIHGYAFGWRIIKTLYIPSSVKYFGDGSFRAVKSLSNIHIEGNIINSPEYLFYESKIQNIYYKGSVPINYDIFKDAEITNIYTCYGYKGMNTFGLKPATNLMNCSALPYFIFTTAKRNIFTKPFVTVLFLFSY